MRGRFVGQQTVNICWSSGTGPQTCLTFEPGSVNMLTLDMRSITAPVPVLVIQPLPSYQVSAMQSFVHEQQLYTERSNCDDYRGSRCGIHGAQPGQHGRHSSDGQPDGQRPGPHLHRYDLHFGDRHSGQRRRLDYRNHSGFDSNRHPDYQLQVFLIHDLLMRFIVRSIGVPTLASCQTNSCTSLPSTWNAASNGSNVIATQVFTVSAPWRPAF